MARLLLGGTLTAGLAAAGYMEYQWRFNFYDPSPPSPKPLFKNQKAADAAVVPPLGLAGLGMTAYNTETLREPVVLRKPLTTDDPSDVYDCIVIGGGLAGLHTALALAEKNKRVLVLEGNRVGGGASGRNGGDAIIGFQTPLDWLVKIVGKKKARELYSHSEMGFERLKGIIQKYKIQCDAQQHGALTVCFRNPADRDAAEKQAIAAARGLASAPSSPSDAANTDAGSSGTGIASAVAATFRKLVYATPSHLNITELQADANETANEFGEKLEVWSSEKMAETGFHSVRFSHGYFDPRNVELNPLDLVNGLARACEETKKVTICETSPVVDLQRSKGGEKWEAKTALGAKAYGRNVVLATSSAPYRLAPLLALKTVPFATSMMLTTPIPKEDLDAVFTSKYAVFDERFALSYFRRVEGNRILFGALASPLPLNSTQGYLPSESLVQTKLFEDLYKTFPSLHKKSAAATAAGGSGNNNENSSNASSSSSTSLYPLRAERCWQGRLNACFPLFPLVGRQSNGLYYSLGYCGHGLVPTCAAGELIASAISDGDTRYQLWSEVPMKYVPLGGPWGYLGGTVLQRLQVMMDKKAGRI